MKRWHQGRSLPLDMLRGIAILLVLGRHSVMVPTGLGPLEPLALAWRSIGWSGVDLFFVLSGFLVSGLFFAEYRKSRTVNVQRFLIRRGFKIWPPYFAYIAFVALWLEWLHLERKSPSVWQELWPNVLQVQNYFHTPRIHTWSLAVEEHFYLGLALLFFLLLRTRCISGFLRHLPILAVIFIFAAAALRHAAYLRDGPEGMNLYATHLRYDGLLVGTLIAYWTHFHPDKLARLVQHPLALIIGGAVLAAPTLSLTPEASPWSAGLGLTGVYVGFGLIMLGWLHLPASHTLWERMFATRPARGLGQIGFYSFSIYLWHVDLAQTPLKKIVHLALSEHMNPGLVWLTATAVYVVAAVIAGRLLAQALERPSLRMRDRLFPALAKPIAQS
jgi:peptidoglycan/LPS O-acetylase OafA/YrhL